MRLGSRVAVAVAVAGGFSSAEALAWEPPYALKRPKEKKEKSEIPTFAVPTRWQPG